MDGYVNEDDWDSWNNWEGVNEGPNENKIILKHYKRKINSKQHNDLNK
jgi:hypothetical protein